MATCDVVTTVNQAARHGNIQKLKKLIKNGHPFDVLDNQGWSCLHEAANNNHFSCLQYLLQNFKSLNDKINMKAHDGCTALFLASHQGNISCMKILLEHKADVNATNFMGETPLHLAVSLKNFEATKLLIKYKCDLNLKQSYDEYAAMHLAVEGKWSEGLQLLLEAGAFIRCRRMDGITPVFMAAQLGEDELLEIILRYSNIKENNSISDEESSTKLVDICACDFASPLFIASQYGCTSCVRMLLEVGADANITTTDPVALPLHAAVEFNYIDCFDLLLPHTSVDALLGCDINLLKSSVRRDNDQRIFEKLIDCDWMRKHLAYGIKMTARNHHNYPETLVDFNSKVLFNESISITTYLVLHDANMSLVEFLISRNFEVNEKHAFNLFMPIHAAVLRRSRDWIRFLVINGAIVNLYHANVVGNILLVMSLFCLPIFHLLLQYGAEADSLLQSTDGNDCLSICEYMMPMQFLSDGQHIVKLYKLLVTFTAATSFPHPMKSLSSPRNLSHLCRVAIRKEIPAPYFHDELKCFSAILPQQLINYLLFSNFDFDF